MPVMTPPCAAEISLFFTYNDHNAKHLLSASAEGTFLEFPLLISQQLDPETVWELRRTSTAVDGCDGAGKLRRRTKAIAMEP